MPHYVESQYRSTAELPNGILDNITVCIEEGLYSQAFSLLTSTITAGTSTPRPALVPPHHVYSLTVTLATHPSMTTRTTNKDKQHAANDAIRYLRLSNKVVGSGGAALREAFRFGKSKDLRGQRALSRRSLDFDDKPVEPLRCIYNTDKQSLWDRAEDFWHLLGWALNCSVIEPRRWERWHLLLNVMLDVLEDDLQQAIIQNTPEEPKSSQLDAATLDDTLLVKYLSTADSGRNNKRRIMRAILADGTSKSLAEFGQIWDNETAEPKKASTSKRQKLDIDKGKYGDYDEDSEDDLRRTVLSLKPVTQLVPSTTSYDFSNQDAMTIRQRVLALLTKLCTTEPEAFISAEDLFDVYAEIFKQLPLVQFQDLAMGLGDLLDDDSQSSMYQMLLRASIDSSAPVYNRNDLNQDDFERHFAPYAANLSGTAEDAKVSLLVEGLLRLLWKHEMLDYTQELANAVKDGISARSERASPSKGDDYDIQCLQASAQRMLLVLKVLQDA